MLFLLGWKVTIGGFAKLSGITQDTVRYYEKIGLLRRIDRDRNGRRAFQQADLSWIEFVIRLKETGMSLAEIHRYADLREKGESTLEKRYQLLKQHAVVLSKRMEIDRINLAKLKEKMALYRREINRKKSS
jgi:DNA-binding transcriptional MerR regulator